MFKPPQPVILLNSIEQLHNDVIRLKLYTLYQRYSDVLEHLLVIDGSIPNDEYKYNDQLIKGSYRTWLNDQREGLFNEIQTMKKKITRS